MQTTKAILTGWFKAGARNNCTHMIVVCDTFAYDDYPVYVEPDADFWELYDSHDGPNMTRIMEVYDLNMDMDLQMAESRAWHYPPRPTRDTIEP